jgi:uncharacterized protein
LERGCAAKANFGQACVNLGKLFRDGMGVDKDLKRAAELFERACSYNANRCAALAKALVDGAGVAKNRDRAAELYEKACADDDDACIAGSELVRDKSPQRARAMLQTACNETRDHVANKAACEALKKIKGR